MKDALKFPPFAKGAMVGMIAVALGFYALLYFSGATVSAGTVEPVAGPCFPASAWSGDDGARPCAEVVSIEEDGSARVIQRTADDSFRAVCILPNPAEEGRHYVAVCRRSRHAHAIPLPLPLPIPKGAGRTVEGR